MKKSIANGLIGVLAILCTSCASYSARTLSNLASTVEQSQSNAVSLTVKAFTKEDCKRYFDRDVIAAGYQPIQLCIQNNSDHPIALTMDRISLPCATAEEVAEKVHTSTIGRVTGYVVGSLFLWPLLIPAVVDGIMSHQANGALDADFASKVAEDQTIFPHARLNKVIFVPVQEYQERFSITLVDVRTNQPEKIQVTVL